MKSSYFDTLGVMLDCSRNAVMTLEEQKKFIELLSRMGYNQLQLYMEDTYEAEGEPFFGYLRGKYSCEELSELDEFAFQHGVELIPNIQTLAHLTTFLRWRPDLKDTDSILLVGEPKVYESIEKMLVSLRKCFRTDKIHIGMDEAHALGKGKYYDIHGARNRFEIILEHLNQVCLLTEKYHFKPMIWSDMFFRLAANDRYYVTDVNFDASIKEKIPENLTLVYWDYYSTDQSKYEKMIQLHHQLSDRISFAGGAWKWGGFAPHNNFSIQATKAAMEACKKEGIREIVLTMWGDDGAECSAFSTLPSLCYAACLAQGITKMSDIREKFQEWTGYRFDDFLLLDSINLAAKNSRPTCPSKYSLYTDCFASIYEGNVEQGDGEKYAAVARKLRYAEKRCGEYSYIFHSLSKLASVLEVKAELCTKTRAAYETGDTEEIRQVILLYKKAIRRTEEFYVAFRNQWYTENKPQGFEVHDIRLGGLIRRLTSCMERLTAFAEGKVNRLPELEEELIPLSQGHVQMNSWKRSVTGNVL